MNSTFETIAIYLARVAPGLMLGGMMLFLARREARVRIILYLALFILLRDTLTPLGLWSFGTQAFFWIRLHTDPGFLAAFGLACLGLSLGIYYLDRDNQSLIRWTRGKAPPGILWGVGGAIVVAAPFVALYHYTPIESRGGQVPLQNVPGDPALRPAW